MLLDSDAVKKALYDAVDDISLGYTAVYGIEEDNIEKIIDSIPPAQTEEAIPVSWIEARIKRFMTMDNAFGGLTANIILVMLLEWKREQEGETE